MTYTVITTTTLPAPEKFYMDTTAEAAADVAVIVQFRTSQPGYISESSEIVDADTRKFTIVYDSKASYDAYQAGMSALPEDARRDAYYGTLSNLTVTYEVIDTDV